MLVENRTLLFHKNWGEGVFIKKTKKLAGKNERIVVRFTINGELRDNEFDYPDCIDKFLFRSAEDFCKDAIPLIAEPAYAQPYRTVDETAKFPLKVRENIKQEEAEKIVSNGNQSIESAQEHLKQYFGYTSFKKGQEAIITQILNSQDAIGIMPTGAGKSLCFQVPALLFKGVTLVISPLISLMKDQVDTLRQMGIAAAFINSTLNYNQLKSVMNNAKKGLYKLLYIAPERLDNEEFISLISEQPISMVAIDEAHCISQWGHDFRPSYMNIANMISSINPRPIVTAFTATATPSVILDIERMLELHNPFKIVTGFDRENLYFEVVKPPKKYDYLLQYIKQNTNKSGIIYAATRKNVEEVCEKLNKSGIRCTRYHAGLSETERTKNQEEFIDDKTTIIVATNAFGMGIDKSNVRFVIHYNMPKNMESYYQEAGRAGRDGEKADCILLYSGEDIITNKFLIEKSVDRSMKAENYRKLNEIIDYCNTYSCLRKYILRYFGEEEYKDNCGNCSICLSDIEKSDITLESQKILSCIKRMNERFGSQMVADVLRASKNSKVLDNGFDQLSTYGIMKEYDGDVIRDLIAYLVAIDYLIVRGTEYPTLSVSKKANDILFGDTKVYIKKVIERQKKTQKKERVTGSINDSLFEKLRMLRKSIAQDQKVPPYVVFSDASLVDMCKRMPVNRLEMLNVLGVGDVKLKRYGDRFLEIINDHVEATSSIF